MFTVNEGNRRPSDSVRWKQLFEGVWEGGESQWRGMPELGRGNYRHRRDVRGVWIEYSTLAYRKVEGE